MYKGDTSAVMSVFSYVREVIEKSKVKTNKTYAKVWVN